MEFSTVDLIHANTHTGSLAFAIDVSRFEVGYHKLKINVTDILNRTSTVNITFLSEYRRAQVHLKSTNANILCVCIPLVEGDTG